MAVPADVFEPDLIVTADGGTEFALVVEAKLVLTQFADRERQLKEYMVEMRISIGVLASPTVIRLYRNEYVSTAEESVQLIGEYVAPSDWAMWRDIPVDASAASRFEDVVHVWLDGLLTEPGLRALRADFRRAAEQYLVPAMNEGDLRAAHPRRA